MIDCQQPFIIECIYFRCDSNSIIVTDMGRNKCKWSKICLDQILLLAFNAHAA